MERFPSLLDPKNYIRSESERRIARELNIATEIYLADKCARIHYEDLMSDIEEGQATKQMLTWQLNDNTKKGIISLYMTEHQEDFHEGKWQPMYFGRFLQFAAIYLTDKDFVNSKAKSQMFAYSIRNAKWFAKASALMGLKLLESVFRKGGITSIVANAVLEMNFNSRELLESNARIVGRVVKNNGGAQDLKNDINNNFEYFFQKQSRLTLKRYEQHEEHNIYLAHKPAIERAIAEVPQQLMSLY